MPPIKVIFIILSVSSSVITQSNVIDWSNYYKYLNGDSVGTTFDNFNFNSFDFSGNVEGSVKDKSDGSFLDRSESNNNNALKSVQDSTTSKPSFKSLNLYQPIDSLQYNYPNLKPLFQYNLQQDGSQFKIFDQSLNYAQSKLINSGLIPFQPLDLTPENSESNLYQSKDNGTKEGDKTVSTTHNPLVLNPVYNGPFNPGYYGSNNPSIPYSSQYYGTINPSIPVSSQFHGTLQQSNPFSSQYPGTLNPSVPYSSQYFGNYNPSVSYSTQHPGMVNPLNALNSQRFGTLNPSNPFNYQHQGILYPSAPINPSSNVWNPSSWDGYSLRFAHPPYELKPHRPKLSTMPVVKTDKGLVRGSKMTSRSGNDYYAFTSIPYAKPPVGPLRFERPVPADEWEGVKEGPEDLPDCWQIQNFNPYQTNVSYGTEDCLYLSVFTPQITGDRKLPVMIYIHGGAYRTEFPSAGKAIRSKYLMDEDIVLVIFKYRVGAFGFLSLEDHILPGNMGLKDSALLLAWVSKNINEFGGDPHRITLFGNSAGGSTVHYLLTSPMTKHLAHQGISQSGVANCHWAFGTPGVGRYRASRLAEHLNCPLSLDVDLLNCLKNKTAKEIADADEIFRVRDFDPPAPYQPVLELGSDCIICDSPYNLPMEKPWIVGVNQDEGAFKSAWYTIIPELADSFRERGADFLPEGFMYTNSTTYAKDISDALITKYEGIIGLSELWTDGLFYSGVTAALKRVAYGPTYFYLLSHRGKTSVTDLLAQQGNIYLGNLGVAHTDELFYLFNYEDDYSITLPPKDVRVSKSFIKLWTNFAKHGRPTKHDEWPQYDRYYRRYLNISTENLSVGSNLWHERAEFWENIPVRNILEAHNL